MACLVEIAHICEQCHIHHARVLLLSREHVPLGWFCRACGEKRLHEVARAERPGHVASPGDSR